MYAKQDSPNIELNMKMDFIMFKIKPQNRQGTEDDRISRR